ncbi:hypothetical protein FEZ41_03145 [Lentilactobacillus parafarraginis]|mgnify:CR=1 FL=1|jgi:hypothetical protein|uniref:Uncharacterized protein n=2 Tax=Lentilactobacillus parafarraginis TaxID=390842 RepID=A0A0R1YN45_9LACO|nr:hypothetical protein [Lentilactobacillus parafarraginis]KRM44014.1 hypothetical protein FD47_GL001050 [Lentilactobacillus parafarraginis DSM 18390 = JCM 14109]TLQ20391.1 hypothetical protein FEZ41_03145 [Lentilactobacillus parafarraginis]
MSTKVKLAILWLIIYIIFAVGALYLGVLAPAKIGITWSIFWYIAAALIAYYLWFKNVVYQRVMYYARALKLSQSDLRALIPNLKQSQVVPDPNRKNYFAPIFNFPLQGLDILDKKLRQQASERQIPPFK